MEQKINLDVAEKSWTREFWSIGQVIARRDIRGRFMVGHRSMPPNMKTADFVESAKRNLAKAREKELVRRRREGKTEKQMKHVRRIGRRKRTLRQMEAIKKNLEKGGWKGTEKQLEAIKRNLAKANSLEAKKKAWETRRLRGGERL